MFYMADIRRSKALDASLRYWRWYGKLPKEWGDQLFGGRRSWFAFGSCLAFVLLFVFVIAAYVAVFLIAAALLVVFAIIGGVLSLVGGLDQLRLNVVDRNRTAEIG